MGFPSRSASRRSQTTRRSQLRVQLLEDRLQPNAGVLDPSFGIGGQVTPTITSSSVLVQPWDNKIIVAGSSGGNMSLARYNTDGSLDAGFGSGGVAISTFAGGGVSALYLQTGSGNDGKIVAASGSSVVRFNADGSVDSTFASGGKATLPWSGNIGSVVVQPDGKVVVSGVVFSTSTTADVTRLNANGTVDTSFASQGTWHETLTGVGSLYSPLVRVRAYAALQSDGKILVQEPFPYLSNGYGWFVKRLTTAGALDATFPFTSFGSTFNGPNGAAIPAGIATYPPSDVTDAGKILAVGYTFHISNGPAGGATVLARYNSDGTLDSSFGQGGKAIGANSGTNDTIAVYSTATQADGKAIVVGTNFQRYNTDGSLDTTFGTGGIVATRFTSVAIQLDGNIDVTNSTALARYLWSDGPPPPPPSTFVSINDVSVAEGNAGTSSMNFTVTLSAPIADPVTVQFLTADGSATSGSDYQSTGGTLTFAPGETSQTVSIPIIGDRVAENNETFTVNLSSAVNAGYADNQGVGTIVDDEPRIAIGEVSMTEGNTGTKNFMFTVMLSAAYDQAVTMSYQTANGTATTGNNDYVAKSGTLIFNAGETQKTITITVNGDKKRESDETIFVNLTGNSSNSLFADAQGVGTILNDD